MKLSAILLLVLLGIIVWSTLRMNRRREEARRDRDGGSGSEMTSGAGGRDKRGDPDSRGDASDGGGDGGGD
jgi:hypothetical protein